MNRLPAKVTQLIDDDLVRVTRFDFDAGAETGWHTHEMDYVIIAITTCQMQLEEPGGNIRSVTVAQGEAYRRNAGVEHNVINAGSTPMAFVEIELK